MLNRAHQLSSLPDLFAAECDNLKEIFLKLKYPEGLVNSLINRFIESHDQEQALYFQFNKPVQIILPFKDQRSAGKDSSPISRRKWTATCAQCLQARKLLMRSKWHLLLMNNALFMNTNVICVMQVMWAIHADTYFNALINIRILSLVNACGAYTICGTKIFMTNLQSSRNAVRSWIV